MFNFDSVFGQQSTQDEVYQEVQNLIQSFIDGYDVTIFAYGQTGSGKTYTMGTEISKQGAAEGIIPRAIKQIFGEVEARRSEGNQPEVKVSFQEIYMDSVRDLLNPANCMTQNNQALKYEAE